MIFEQALENAAMTDRPDTVSNLQRRESLALELHAKHAWLGVAELVASKHCNKRAVRAVRILKHVHLQTANSTTERVECNVAFAALHFGSNLLLAHRTTQRPTVLSYRFDALDRLHSVAVKRTKLRNPLHTAREHKQARLTNLCNNTRICMQVVANECMQRSHSQLLLTEPPLR